MVQQIGLAVECDMVIEQTYVEFMYNIYSNVGTTFENIYIYMRKIHNFMLKLWVWTFLFLRFKKK